MRSTFRVHQDREKFIQTGDSPRTSHHDDDHEKSLTERLLNDMKRMLKVEEEEEDGGAGAEEWECITLTEVDEAKKMLQTDCSSDYESMVELVSYIDSHLLASRGVVYSK